MTHPELHLELARPARAYDDDDLLRHIGELPARASNALARHGITTLGELRAFIGAGYDPRDIRWIGAGTMAAITDLLIEQDKAS